MTTHVLEVDANYAGKKNVVNIYKDLNDLGAVTSDFRTRVTTNLDLNVTVHEVGHLMGLEDQHSRAGAQPANVDWTQLQKDGNVMAVRNGRNLVDWQITQILNSRYVNVQR